MNRPVSGSLVALALLALQVGSLEPARATTEGRTQGSFAVSPTGAATYSIPIWTPPGPRGIQPSIALSYNSQVGNSYVGVGWSVSGLGAVTRCNLTFAQDAAPAPVTLATSDGYCLNGKRLRLTSGTYGTAGSTYQTEVADFTQITMNGTAGNGPSYFSVQMGNGQTYYYGYTDANGNGANSQVLANGTSTADYWFLSKVTDSAGNNFVVNYTLLTGISVPANIKWTPTGAGASTYTYQMTFNYGGSGNNAQTSTYGYVAGTALVNANILSSISISLISSSTVVKDYFLGYTTSPTTGRYELQTVTECADSAESNCLLPTNVTYQSGTAGTATTATTAVSSTSSGANLVKADVNGDGYPDLVYSNGTTVYVAFGSASGYGTPVSTGISAANRGPVGDLMATGKDGILGNSGGIWYYYTWNGSGFSSVSTGITWPGASVSSYLLDTNGDGLPDLVTFSGSRVGIQLNTGAGAAVSFQSTASDAYDATPTTTMLLASANGTTWGSLRSWDFNGDGRQDMVLFQEQLVFGTPLYIVTVLISNGTTFTGHQLTVGGGLSNFMVLNWNNDACTDFVYNTVIYVSGCSGTSATTYSITGTVLAALDWNGDGRTDLLVADGSYVGVALSNGNGVASTVATSVPYSSSCAYFAIDVNGDGLDDLGCQTQSGTYPVKYYLHSGAGTPPDLMNKVADGYGNSVSPTYESLVSSVYEEYSDAVYPDKNYIGPMYAVNTATFSDPSQSPGSTYVLTYWFEGGWMNVQGRGFDGFYVKANSDSRVGLYNYDYYKRPFLLSGALKRKDVTTAAVYLVDVTDTWTYTTLSSTPGQQIYFPYVSTSTRTEWESGGPKNGDPITVTTTNFAYDNYGNPTTVTKSILDNDCYSPNSPTCGDTWTTTTTNTPDVDTATWCLHLYTETQVAYTASIGSSVTRTKAMTPDLTNCRYTTLVTEPTANGGLYKVTESLAYDGFGNIYTDTVLGNNMPNSPASRVTTATWGTTGQFPNTLTDPSGAVTTWTYTSNQALTFGQPDSKKDANNLTTSWTYDPFGRKTKESRPDSTSTTWTWSACTSYCGWSNSVYQVAQTLYQTNGTTAIRTDTTLYDPLDRVTQTAGPNVAGTTATVQKQYNSLGLLTQQSLPFLTGGTVFHQSYAYDLRNRVTSSTRPVSATNSTPQSTTILYEGRTSVTTDPLGHTKTTVNDVKRQLRQTTDGLGYTITRAFDAAGSLTGITDSVGNTLLSGVTYNYGLKPYRVASTDADRGSWTYTVDSLGERIGWTDAKGQSFSMTYDALSRPLTRTEPDLFTQWTWGSTPGSYNEGQLISECTGTGTACTSSQYGENRTYDSYGRLSTRAISAYGLPGSDPGGVELYTLGYSATTGFLSSLTYPKTTSSYALNLAYGYGYGLLQTITDTTDSTSTCGTTCVLWTANAMNAFGQVTQETLGNNIVVNRSYDGVTSWLTGATAGVGSGAGVLNQSYLWDDDGDMTQRQNNNLGLTESFNYDADNRLTCVALAPTCSGSTIVYDGGAAGPGNITSMAGVGTYSYPTPGSARPHAVTSITGSVNGITNPSFSYDANGNMTDRASTTANVSWSSYNYPTQISGTDATGTETVSFAYGPDRQRWEQVYTGTGSLTETTYYAGGLMDVVYSGGVYNYRHYINAGKESVAVYSRTTSGGVTMSYFLQDPQQSVASITSNSGAVDVNESFTPFGNRRNPTTWSGAPATSDLNTIAGLSRQGYTFQTALGQSLGLNHMNGRVQDAYIGRWLSADPEIPDPTSAQSYNRYAYVQNNPMSRIDPTGFDDDCEGQDDCLSEVVVTAQAALEELLVTAQKPSDDPPPQIPVTLQDFQFSPPPTISIPTINTAQGPQPCGSGLGTASNNATPTPVTDNQGNPIQGVNPNGTVSPMLAPAGLPPSFFAATGNLVANMANSFDPYGLAPAGSAFLSASNLFDFRQGASFDAQRVGGGFNGSFTSYSNYAFGIYTASAGLSLAQALSGANQYAGVAANYSGNQMSTAYPNLLQSNVTNITNGYNAYQGGQLCTR